MRFKNLDLNLLVALDVLLQERSVSAAADRLCLSQSAMSGALARLREHFQDEILIQIGRKMAPTALAESLAEPVRRLLLQIETTVGAGVQFDPATSTRKFTIVASDYITEVLAATVVRVAAERAPGVSISIEFPHEYPAGLIEAGDIDFLVSPDLFCSPSHPMQLLYEEEHVVAGWAENETLHPDLSLDEFFAMGHVVVRFSRARQLSYAEMQMAAIGRERRIEVVAPSFTSVPSLLIGTRRIALMHRRLAVFAARTTPLKFVRPPFEIPKLREMVQSHQVRAHDAGLNWLRALMLECAAALP